MTKITELGKTNKTENLCVLTWEIQKWGTKKSVGWRFSKKYESDFPQLKKKLSLQSKGARDGLNQ